MARKNPATAAYYEMNADFTRGGSPCWEFVNYCTVQKDRRGILNADPWPDGYLQMPRGPWRLPDFAEVPRFLIDKKLGRPLRDIENWDGIFFVSAQMKTVLEELDAAAFELRRCETFLSSGEPGRETWLCAVTRAFRGAIDEEKSERLEIRQGPDGLPSYSMNAFTKLLYECVHQASLQVVCRRRRPFLSCRRDGWRGFLRSSGERCLQESRTQRNPFCAMFTLSK